VELPRRIEEALDDKDAWLLKCYYLLMVKVIISALLGLLLLSGCGYQGSYRYPCQDPVNWDAKECVVPECLALGLCTKDILGFDPSNPESYETKDMTTQGEANG
jgi:hypothetical protein